MTNYHHLLTLILAFAATCAHAQSPSPTLRQPQAPSADDAPPFLPSSRVRPTRKPHPTKASSFMPQHTNTYPPCGGFRPTPLPCAAGEICIDDPYRSGCGMACDAPGICVKPVACGVYDGFGGRTCRDRKKCVKIPSGDCELVRGGESCPMICV